MASNKPPPGIRQIKEIDKSFIHVKRLNTQLGLVIVDHKQIFLICLRTFELLRPILEVEG